MIGRFLAACCAAMLPLLLAASGSSDAEGPPAGAPEGYRLIEGDILVPRTLDEAGNVSTMLACDPYTATLNRYSIASDAVVRSNECAVFILNRFNTC